MQVRQADVVIIGGGAAGTYLALCLRKAGINPVILAKGLIGKSGASIFAGNLNLHGRVFGGSDEEAAAMRDYIIRWYNHYLIDQDYALKGEKWTEFVYYPELEEAGLYFRRDDQGKVVTSYGLARGAAIRQQGQSGILLMDLRRKQVRCAQIETYQETAVTNLIKNENGEIAGVVAFHCPTGDILVLHADAVVIATGPADRIATRSTGTREQSGDGIALAYRAGGELLNLEMQWWHASDFKWPPCWQRMHVYPNPLVGTSETARMYNADGVEFFDQSRDAPNSYAPYPTQFKALAKQIELGKARLDGGYYSGYDHIDAEVLRNYVTTTKAFEKVGIPAERARVETAATWHYRQGGINANPHTMETNVAGLYVAGPVGGHNNGSLGYTAYDAFLCAETLKGKFSSRRKPKFSESTARLERDRVLGLLRALPDGGITPMALKAKIRDLMYDKMGFLKTRERMEEALAGIIKFRTELAPQMGLRDLTRRQNYGWLDALDVFNLLDTSEITIRSALNRKESRGAFYRTDYPYTDNENWLVKNIGWRAASGSVQFRLEPYNTQYYRPEFAKEHFLEVLW
jgi:succinate dehydrogenase / fumarate reductase flavoprotein subunit